jgi:ribosomal protein S18 acetylase RimI-like enzyme
MSTIQQAWLQCEPLNIITNAIPDKIQISSENLHAPLRNFLNLHKGETYMGIVIRPIRDDEVIETVTIYLECLQDDYSFKPKTYLDSQTVEDNLAECKNWLYASGDHNQIFAAMDCDVMVGYIAVGPNVGIPMEYEGEVCGFFIRKAYRNRGIGLKLLQVGLTHMHKLEYSKVVIYNYRISRANSYYRSLRGKLVHQEIQSPGGMNLETDVFGWEIAAFLAIVEERLRKYEPAGDILRDAA